MKQMRWMVALAAMTMVALLSTSAMAQDGGAQRVAVVDLQRALLTVEDGQNARSELEADMQRRQAEFEDAQASLEEDAAAFEASMNMLTQEAAMERYQELQQRAMALEQQYATHQQELARAEAQATQGIAERMIGIAEQIATDQGYDLVIDASAVVYVGPGIDVTDELVRRYDEQY